MSDTTDQGERSDSGKAAYSTDDSTGESGEVGFRGKTVALVEEGQIDPAYHAKVQLLNDAIQEIGMGKYQWHLFCVAGFGWFSDNVYLTRFQLTTALASSDRPHLYADCLRVRTDLWTRTYARPKLFISLSCNLMKWVF